MVLTHTFFHRRVQTSGTDYRTGVPGMCPGHIDQSGCPDKLNKKSEHFMGPVPKGTYGLSLSWRNIDLTVGKKSDAEIASVWAWRKSRAHINRKGGTRKHPSET